METNPKDRETADKILKLIENKYGKIPLINTILAERPDMFIPMANFAGATLEGKGGLDQKTRYLIAVGAASALGSPYCVGAQMDHAIQMGATRDEILETMIIGSYMAMTRSQSQALREFEKRFGKP